MINTASIKKSALEFVKPGTQRRRLAMTIAGVILCAFAVGFFKCSDFGVDPFQCFAMGSWAKITGNSLLSYGSYYMILSLIMLVVDLFLDKHYIGLATLINLFLTGYIVDFSTNIINSVCPDPSLAVKIVFLVIGIVVMCFASALYMTSDLGVSVYDAIPIIISNRTKFQFRFVRIAADFICVAIGTACVLLGGEKGVLPGIGTIVTAFFMGPLVDFFNRKFAIPFLNKAKKAE